MVITAILVRSTSVSETYGPEKATTIDLAAEIVSAYVSNNHVAAHDLPGLIVTVDAALKSIATGATVSSTEVRPEHATPAQIRKSITPDALISFVDGKPYKTLKRHLTKHGLDPASYRARFGLPADYPTTSASYSAQRSSLARQNHLGQRGAVEAAPKKAGRASKQAAA
jgi:predicted transcriptional regulator